MKAIQGASDKVLAELNAAPEIRNDPAQPIDFNGIVDATNLTVTPEKLATLKTAFETQKIVLPTLPEVALRVRDVVDDLYHQVQVTIAVDIFQRTSVAALALHPDS